MIDGRTDARPEPLVPSEVDLTDFPYLPLDVRRLRDSRLAATATGDEFMSWTLLLCASWHQRPAGSLPDDDVELAQLAGYGRVVREWLKVKEGALYGWVRCSDGRLYHAIVAQKAIEAWEGKLRHAWRKECDRLRKENRRRAEVGEPALRIPSYEAWKSSRGTEESPSPSADDPPDGARKSTGAPTECDRPAPGIPSDGTRNSDGNALRSVGIPPPSDGLPAENALIGRGRGRRKGRRERASPDELATSGGPRAENAVASPSPDRALKDPDYARLRSAVRESFVSRSPDRGLSWSWVREDAAIDRLMERASHEADPADWLKRYLSAAWQLRAAGRGPWEGQPWVPHVVCGERMMVRVVEAMAVAVGDQLDPGVAEFVKNWGKR